MGTWDNTAWGNDLAADWFSDLNSETHFCQTVHDAIKNPDAPAAIRQGAAWVFNRIGGIYVWDLDSFDAIKALLENAAVSALVDPETAVSLDGYDPTDPSADGGWLAGAMRKVNSNAYVALLDPQEPVEVRRAAAWLIERLAVRAAWYEPDQMAMAVTRAFEQVDDVVVAFMNGRWGAEANPQEWMVPLLGEFYALADHPANEWNTLAGSAEGALAYRTAGISLAELRDLRAEGQPVDLAGAWTLAGLRGHPITGLIDAIGGDLSQVHAPHPRP